MSSSSSNTFSLSWKDFNAIASHLTQTSNSATSSTYPIWQSKTSRNNPLLHTLFTDVIALYPRNVIYGNDQNVWTTVRFANIHDLLANFFLINYFGPAAIQNWRKYCIGVTSKYYNTRIAPKIPEEELHLPMFDYDGRNIKRQLRKDVAALQEKYELADATVYKTRRGYHVYFLTDSVPYKDYRKMLDEAQCCDGFKAQVHKYGGTILRVSAKYSKFDITPEYVLASEINRGRRKTVKAHMIEQLIQLGQNCGTHIASLYPQWAKYHEDKREWRPNQRTDVKDDNQKRGRRGRRIRRLQQFKQPLRPKQFYRDLLHT